MNTEEVACFIEVAERLSFSETARHLFVTQPTVSRRVMRLERELGALLFDRSDMSLKLTEVGKLFLPEAKEILRRVETATERIKHHQKGMLGEVNIACYGRRDHKLLALACEGMRGAYPNVVVSIRKGNPGQAIGWLLEGVADVAMAIMSELHPLHNAYITPLQPMHWVLLVPADHPLSQQNSVHISALRHMPLAMCERAHSPCTYDAIVAAFLECGFAPNLVAAPSNADDLLLTAIAGQGLSIYTAGTEHNVPNDLCPVRLEGLSLDPGYGAASLKNNGNPALPWFLNILEESARQLND